MALLRPRWLALHAFVVVACVSMVMLGRWQWDVAGQRRGDIRNYAYALQWWLFVGFALVFWARIVHDARRPRVAAGIVTHPAADAAGGAPSSVGFRPYVMPQADAIDVEDPELAAYNAYLTVIAQPAHISAGNNPTPSQPVISGDRGTHQENRADRATTSGDR